MSAFKGLLLLGMIFFYIVVNGSGQPNIVPFKINIKLGTATNDRVLQSYHTAVLLQ